VKLGTGRCATLTLDGQDETVREIFNGGIYGIETPTIAGLIPNWLCGNPEPILRRPMAKAEAEVRLIAAVESQRGYLESCGCKAGQMGGVAKRKTLLDDLEGALIIDCGRMLSGRAEGAMTAIEVNVQDAFLRAMERLPLDAAVPSWVEVGYGLDRLRTSSIPWTCCNVLNELGTAVLPEYRTVRIGDAIVGIVGWLASSGSLCNRKVLAGGIVPYVHDESPARLKKAIDQARSKADVIVVVGDIGHWWLRDNREALDSCDIVVTADIFRADKETLALPAGSYLRRFPPKVYNIGQTVILSAGSGPSGQALFEQNIDSGDWSATSASLSEEVDPDEEIEALIRAHMADARILLEEIERYLPQDIEFVGSKECRPCHQAYYNDWSATRHAQAMNTLRARYRDMSPECVKCHVTGYGYNNGYAQEHNRDALAGVQCEACHGPGSKHIASGRTDEIIRQPNVEMCFECHDEEHSDQFQGRLSSAFSAVSHPLVPRVGK
jgi:hypothetical protein